MKNFYDGTKLLSLKDKNGEKPEIYICCGNRSAGKTTYFSRLLVNRFLKKGEKFLIEYRFKDELSGVSEKFFKDIKTLFFPGHEMTEKVGDRGNYYELFLDGASCGYAVALNASDKIRRYSHFFSDVSSIFFDEFQSETNHYCSKEVEKFISIHTSISRGSGKAVRYVPCYLCSNTVTLLNPYFSAMGISSRVRDNTKFLRGDGWVMEYAMVENAARAQKGSAFNRAFSGNRYIAYSSENVYLNDNYSFIEKPAGKGSYLLTFRYNGKNYGLREYAENGFLYVNKKPDLTFSKKISVTTEDHNINYVMLKNNDLIITTLREYFNKGCIRFFDLESKEAFFALISYH